MGKIKTLSQVDPVYAALERAIEIELSISKREKMESEFMHQLMDRNKIQSALIDVLGSAVDESITKIMNVISPADMVLPTIYDDPVSYSITSKLIDQIRDAATMLDFEQSGYGGFCCAPTGYVGAMAIPVVINGNNESKVFVVFESGLLTFIDGIIRLTVDAAPINLLAGDTPDDWNNVWDSYKSDTTKLSGLREISADLRAWIGFLKMYDRKKLAYVGLQGMQPMKVHVVASMVESAQLFVTAHEYVHAIERHDNPKLADDYVEKEADRIGANLVAKALSRRSDVNVYFSLAGIALAMEAICINHTPEQAHLPAIQRAELMLNAVQFIDPSHSVLARDMMTLYRRIFHDLLNLPAL